MFVRGSGWKKRAKVRKRGVVKVRSWRERETGAVFIFVVPLLPRVRAVEQNSEIRRRGGRHLLWPPRGCIYIHKHNGASWYMRPHLGQECLFALSSLLIPCAFAVRTHSSTRALARWHSTMFAKILCVLCSLTISMITRPTIIVDWSRRRYQRNSPTIFLLYLLLLLLSLLFFRKLQPRTCALRTSRSAPVTRRRLYAPVSQPFAATLLMKLFRMFRKICIELRNFAFAMKVGDNFCTREYLIKTLFTSYPSNHLCWVSC